MTVVRRVRPGEAATLRRVRLAALKDTPSAFGSTYAAESLRGDEEWAERCELGSSGQDRATFFAESDQEIVGLVGGYRAEGASHTVELVSMWSAPSVRRSGVGRALVGAVLDWAKAGGASTVDLWVTRGNAPAEALYRRMGFVETQDHKPLPSDPCKDEVRMTLQL